MIDNLAIALIVLSHLLLLLLGVTVASTYRAIDLFLDKVEHWAMHENESSLGAFRMVRHLVYFAEHTPIAQTRILETAILISISRGSLDCLYDAWKNPWFVRALKRRPMQQIFLKNTRLDQHSIIHLVEVANGRRHSTPLAGGSGGV